VVAETEDLKSLRFNCLRACGIALFGIISEMLPAIEFDDETCRVAHEVSDVAVDRDLTAKARAKQAMAAQLRPQNPLGIR
jgi:hypothetical protein